MAAKVSHNGFLSTSSSNPPFPHKSSRTHFSCKKFSELDRLWSLWGNSKKRGFVRFVLSGSRNCPLSFQPLGCGNQPFRLRRSVRTGSFRCPASADDGITVNGTPQASTSSDVEDLRLKLNQSLNTDNDGLVQFLHESARVFELAIKEQSPFSKLAWFSTAWLGVDRNAWVKTLSYQASTYSLLQAANEIASRGDGRDRDVNVFVQRSLLRQSACLESSIKDKLSNKESAYEWLWSEQVPKAVTSFINYIEEDPRFTAATSVSRKGPAITSMDVPMLMLALTCNAAIIKLGPAKVSCPPFFSTISDTGGRLMEMLVDRVPIRKAYHSVKEVGLAREFLVHFGPRAAACRVKNDRDSEEVIFWVDLIQKQLQGAIDREKIWSRLTTSESIEVLERDLAIFGFFIALGRHTQSYLYAKGFDVVNHPLEGFLRFLIGGSVLYYSQLSSISSYQLYVEVVSEELEWLPFYPGSGGISKESHGHRSKGENPPDTETILLVLDVCSHWMQSFIKHSKWLENPSNVKAAKFLSRGHKKLMECMEELGIRNEVENVAGRTGPIKRGSDSFDKALESVEEALTRLENLLQYLHVSSSNSGKEHLKAACSDLEKIRKLKKEAEFLEASFRAKAASLQEGVVDSHSPSSGSEDQQLSKAMKRKSDNAKTTDRMGAKYPGLWGLFNYPSDRKLKPDVNLEEFENEFIELTPSVLDSEPNEIRRFELLRNELIELEQRVQRSTDRSENAEDMELEDDNFKYKKGIGASQLAIVPKNENFIEKSLDKLKEASTDVWQGTQLLAIDVGASSGLLRRTLIGDELTEKEKKALRRTFTDLASVVPIGVLMLLPVTAVGHAAILAAIQRYVPSLIPSTYGSERLDLLRQLEKVKELESSEESSTEGAEELAGL